MPKESGDSKGLLMPSGDSSGSEESGGSKVFGGWRSTGSEMSSAAAVNRGRGLEPVTMNQAPS